VSEHINPGQKRATRAAASESSLIHMEAEIRTMIEQQLEAQNQRMAEMMTKLDELTKKRSLEVNKEVPS